ncbi:hypothetical protein GCM10009605_27590 [Nocardiopsis composta]
MCPASGTVRDSIGRGGHRRNALCGGRPVRAARQRPLPAVGSPRKAQGRGRTAAEIKKQHRDGGERRVAGAPTARG